MSAVSMTPHTMLVCMPYRTGTLLTPPLLQVVMLTGDNPLTACHVAKELKITHKKTLILTQESDGQWVWQSVGGTNKIAMETSPAQLGDKYDLCLSGDVSAYKWGCPCNY